MWQRSSDGVDVGNEKTDVDQETYPGCAGMEGCRNHVLRRWVVYKYVSRGWVKNVFEKTWIR